MATPSAVASAVNMVINILEPAVAALEGVAHVPASTITQVQTGLDAAKNGAAALATSDSVASAQPTAARIGTDLQAVFTVLAGLPIPPPYSSIVLFASMLLPGVLSGVSMMLAAPAVAKAA
jgi:hypothetical protein